MVLGKMAFDERMKRKYGDEADIIPTDPSMRNFTHVKFLRTNVSEQYSKIEQANKTLAEAFR